MRGKIFSCTRSKIPNGNNDRNRYSLSAVRVALFKRSKKVLQIPMASISLVVSVIFWVYYRLICYMVLIDQIVNIRSRAFHKSYMYRAW